jgi:hypothetical protein
MKSPFVRIKVINDLRVKYFRADDSGAIYLSYCAVFIKMYRERVKAYRKMGYKIVEPDQFFGGKLMHQEHLFL